MKCEKCGKEHDGSFGSGRFCSRSCANSRVQTEEIRKKKSLTLRGTGELKNKETHCLCCGKVLLNYQTKFCSIKCQQDYRKNENIEKWLSSGKCRISTRNNHYVRKYINHEQNNKCAICGIDPEWNGKPIVFILDHINGSHTDNSRENIRLVCPNCDSQLDTYKGKNKGNGRKELREQGIMRYKKRY